MKDFQVLYIELISTFISSRFCSKIRYLLYRDSLYLDEKYEKEIPVEFVTAISEYAYLYAEILYSDFLSQLTGSVINKLVVYLFKFNQE